MPIPGDKIRFYVLRTLSGRYAIQEKTVAQMQEAMKEDPTLASRLENRPYETREEAEKRRAELQGFK